MLYICVWAFAQPRRKWAVTAISFQSFQSNKQINSRVQTSKNFSFHFTAQTHSLGSITTLHLLTVNLPPSYGKPTEHPLYLNAAPADFSGRLTSPVTELGPRWGHLQLFPVWSWSCTADTEPEGRRDAEFGKYNNAPAGLKFNFLDFWSAHYNRMASWQENKSPGKRERRRRYGLFATCSLGGVCKLWFWQRLKGLGQMD